MSDGRIPRALTNAATKEHSENSHRMAYLATDLKPEMKKMEKQRDIGKWNLWMRDEARRTGGDALLQTEMVQEGGVDWQRYGKSHRRGQLIICNRIGEERMIKRDVPDHATIEEAIRSMAEVDEDGERRLERLQQYLVAHPLE